jgi:hypothetical protein
MVVRCNCAPEELSRAAELRIKKNKEYINKYI